MRTNELRKLIVDKLEALQQTLGIRAIYYRLGTPNALYPHVVVEISGANLDDKYLKIYTVDIDVITKNMVDLYTIADGIQDAFNSVNDPQQTILPTFYLVSRISVDDPDKTICREIIRMNVQLYDAQ